MSYQLEVKLKVIELISRGNRVSVVSRKIGIPERTIRRWFYKYKKSGIRGFIREYRDRLEDKIFSLKEEKPWLKLNEIQEILKRKKIYVSKKKIWAILKKYELAGFDKKKKLSFLADGFINENYKALFNLAEKYYKESKTKDCALILNHFPSVPFNVLLSHIPDEYLNLRRRTDKLEVMFTFLPPKEVVQKAGELIKECRKNKSFFQCIRLLLIKSLAYQWISQPREILKSIGDIKKYSDNKSLPSFLNFFMKFLEAHAHALLTEYDRAREVVQELLKRHSLKGKLYLYREISTVFSSLGDFKKAFSLLLKIKVKDDYAYKINKAAFYAIKGEYDNSLEIIDEIKKKKKELSSFELSILSRCYFGKGNLLRSLEYARECLERAKERERKNLIFISSIISASIYSLLNEKEESINILNSASSYLLKDKNYRDLSITNLLSKDEKSIKPACLKHSSSKLIVLLKKAEKNKSYTLYKKAFEFAENKWIKGYFHLFIAFFPNLVKISLQKGKRTFLPDEFFEFPLFKQRADFIKINFLGRISILKDNRKISCSLTSSELALLIYIALNSEVKISINKILQDVWWGRKDVKSLYQTLWKLRKKLNISKKHLCIKGREIHSSLKFLTDYHIFMDIASKAKSFYLMGEYESAERLFKNALKMSKGEVFKKIYNPYLDFIRMGTIFKKDER